MSQSGNGKKEDVKPSDIDIFEKVENENPLTEDQRWFKENLGTGEREIEVNPPEFDGSQDEPQEG
ncbi:hypothetical protein [Nostoc sp. GT001]|uniref:hypothetical protein n=1 Tax=Nostoc sp. GT001 TaxID=3056647 RepID=UPI0025AA9420|nr:hypothetical protein [Nostoc sp. GT001]MDM9583130.1 hypothetical protein [Nostoc sp. GT001]